MEGVNNVSPNQATLHTAAGKSLIEGAFSLTSSMTISFRLYYAHCESFHGGVRDHMIPAYGQVSRMIFIEMLSSPTATRLKTVTPGVV